MAKEKTYLNVCSKMCDQCLFTKNKIVSDQRKEEILNDCEAKNIHFNCHKGTIAGGEFTHLVCRGFYEKRSSLNIHLGMLLNAIKFVNPMQLKKQ